MARNFGRPIDNLIIHCTGSSQNATLDSILTFWKTPKGPPQCKYIPNVQGGMGWNTVGYHYLIGVNGERYILANLSQVTNGVRGYNWNSAHISWIGGFDGIDNRTNAQKAELEKLVKELISPDILGPNINIGGHRDFSPDLNGNGIIESFEWVKICPSFEVNTWLKEIGIKQ